MSEQPLTGEPEIVTGQSDRKTIVNKIEFHITKMPTPPADVAGGEQPQQE